MEKKKKAADSFRQKDYIDEDVHYHYWTKNTIKGDYLKKEIKCQSYSGEGW